MYAVESWGKARRTSISYSTTSEPQAASPRVASAMRYETAPRRHSCTGPGSGSPPRRHTGDDRRIAGSISDRNSSVTLRLSVTADLRGNP